jgi:hypothetical protein
MVGPTVFRSKLALTGRHLGTNWPFFGCVSLPQYHSHLQRSAILSESGSAITSRLYTAHSCAVRLAATCRDCIALQAALVCVIESMAYDYSDLDGRPRSRIPWRLDIIVTSLLAAMVSSAVTIAVVSRNCTSVSHPIGDANVDLQGLGALTCGNSLEEALELDCTFDPLTVRWLRPECSRHGAQEFVDSAGNATYRYWHHSNFTVQYSDYDALSLLSPGLLYWTSQREHVNHCMWLLLRVHHVMEHGGRLDDYTRNYMHSKHCLQMLVDMASNGTDDLEQLPTYGDVGYGEC